MSIEIKYTTDFEKELKRLAKKHPSVYKDLAVLVQEFESNPIIGVLLGGAIYTKYVCLSLAREKAKVEVQE